MWKSYLSVSLWENHRWNKFGIFLYPDVHFLYPDVHLLNTLGGKKVFNGLEDYLTVFDCSFVMDF